MSGDIYRVHWDYSPQFIAVNPLGDEVVLYEADETPNLSVIAKRGGFDNIQCSSYSYYHPGITGVGQINGNVNVFDLTQSTSTILKFRPKQARPCNDLTFGGGLVAAAFDKGRQDNSLQLWNIERGSNPQGANSQVSKPVLSYIPNEAVLSTIFYPESQHSLLCGSYKYLREIDTRSDVPVFQLATKCTLGLTVDPFDTHMFLSLGEDGSLAIWDRRRLSSAVTGTRHNVSETPILQFNKLLELSRKNSSPCFRYSGIRRGEFSSIFNGELIRRWHTGMVPASSISPPQPLNDTVLSSLKAQSSQLYKPLEDSLFVSLVLDVKADYSRVISFDYAPSAHSNTSTNFVCMRQSGLVFQMPVVECIESLDFNSSNEFSIVGSDGALTKFLNDTTEDQSTTDLVLINRVNDFSLSNNDLKRLRDDIESTVDDEESPERTEDDNHVNEEDEDDGVPLNGPGMWKYLDTSEVLKNDICWTVRRRAILGYGHDCEKNIRVLESIDNIDNQLALRNTWKWLSLAKKSLDKGTMVSNGVDLGFLGVLGIWNGIEKLTNPKRFSVDPSANLSDQFFSNTIKLIVNSKGKKAAAIHIPSNSERKAQRKLCLIVSGWYFSDEEFDERLNILMSLGFYEKAAGWAVFHGHVDRAVEILSLLKKERLRLIATAVAAYLAYKNSNVNSPWKDQCRKMASELDNPYLRAIFAFIADNDWWDVLDEHSLPLRERLGVALRFLSDKDLTVYLNRIADYVVSKGELEGLILTGITARGIDLIQSYVDRTSDVQTAALMASFGSPRYLSDNRINHWIDCYRNLLNSWSLFKIRAKFDVQRTKLSKTNAGTVTLAAAPKQVYLQCSRCNKNLSKASLQSAKASQALKLFKNHIQQTDFQGCPYCGAQLPRCSVCLLSLGTPVPFDTPTAELGNSIIETRFREWFSFCLNCNHGCHAHHAEEWFLKHYICPVPDCNCRCNSL